VGGAWGGPAHCRGAMRAFATKMTIGSLEFLREVVNVRAFAEGAGAFCAKGEEIYLTGQTTAVAVAVAGSSSPRTTPSLSAPFLRPTTITITLLVSNKTPSHHHPHPSTQTFSDDPPHSVYFSLFYTGFNLRSPRFFYSAARSNRRPH
jgi:hypothetical protein